MDCEECYGLGGTRECPTCCYEIEGCGTCGAMADDSMEAAVRVLENAQMSALSEVIAERDALKAFRSRIDALVSADDGCAPGGDDDELIDWIGRGLACARAGRGGVHLE